MSHAGIDIEPAHVKSAGHYLRDAATTAATHTAHSLDSSATTAKSHPDWSSAKVLGGCATIWERHLSGLVTRMGVLGDDLVNAAAKYVQTDQQNDSGIAAALREFGH